ncbi:MaoC family dehydratase [Antrihabitans spumae]|uniref:MaoC family dehydratase n=1 Tax=Antrihabitans spumae TaxID=3373370 RepID=A0ABW7K0Y4_9NOCA
MTLIDGPYFEDLRVGQSFDDAPPMTLTDGHAAAHQAIVGDRLRLPLDAQLSERVAGGRLAHPALVWNVAIGQSTVVTRKVKANLFYRGLMFHHAPMIGDTLRTTTTVVALRQNRGKAGRAPTGLAVLRIVTVDQQDRRVLDFHRCAMISLRDSRAQTGFDDDSAAIGLVADQDLTTSISGWRLADFEAASSGLAFRDLQEGMRFGSAGADVVTNAPELARLTLNIAEVHHDSRAGDGRRLVFGGHTIALALAQVSRCLPSVVTVPAWYSCDHTRPVYEGDTVRSEIAIERLRPLQSGGGLVDLRSLVSVDGADGPRAALDWRFVAVVA